MAARPGLIVHQITGDLVDYFRSRLPAGTRFEQLPADNPWKVPDDAEIMVAHAAGLGGMEARFLPKPAGWPHRLKWIHLRSAGLDEYPAWVTDVPLVTTSHGQNVFVAEFAFAAMLSHEKRIPEVFTETKGPADWKMWPLGTLDGKVLGIFGMGMIGMSLAKRARAFDMTVLATRRTQKAAPVEGVNVVSFDEMAAAADHLVIAAPLTEATRGFFDKRVFGVMKRGAHLINVARGGLINETDLRAALDSGHLSGATIDVSEPEPAPAGHWYYNHPKVRFSPHTAYASPLTPGRMTAYFFDNLDCYLRGDIDAMKARVDKSANY